MSGIGDGAVSASIQEHLLRLGRLLDAEERAADHGLQPVQLQALLYLSRANRYSDRPATVAEYLAITRGTASQTVRVLEQRGFVSKHVDPADRRQVHLKLTETGRRVARRALSAGSLERALSAIGGDETAKLEAGLNELLRAFQATNDNVSFGTCRTCRHFRTEPRGRFRCGLTGEPLRTRESILLCREHEELEPALENSV